MINFQMNCTRLFKSSKLTLRILHPRYYALTTSSRIYQVFVHDSRKIYRSPYLNITLKPAKYISNCTLMHTSDSDSGNEKSDNNEKIKKIVEDKEFQNILQDFANDFGVDNESNELLDDIRKNIDGNSEEENLTANSCTNNDESSIALSKGLNKFKEFSDADSAIIHSYEEDYEVSENEPIYHIDHELKPTSPYNGLKRGITGVFDLDELVQVLRKESLLDVTAISIPEELHYADFLVLVTAKSHRHSEAVSELIRKLYKKKKNRKDPVIIVEGKDVPEWKALDMGNIVLHIFLEETRALYDLESLWLLDSKFDSCGNMKSDPMLNIIQEQMTFFNSLVKSSSPDLPKDIS